MSVKATLWLDGVLAGGSGGFTAGSGGVTTLATGTGAGATVTTTASGDVVARAQAANVNGNKKTIFGNEDKCRVEIIIEIIPDLNVV